MMNQMNQMGQQPQQNQQGTNQNPFINPFLNPLFGQGGMNQNFQSQMTSEQAKSQYSVQINQIKEMGFENEEDIIQALIKTNGNVNAAIERLTGP